jgi:formylglycine-generating enzyme required for sulfatase activity
MASRRRYAVAPRPRRAPSMQLTSIAAFLALCGLALAQQDAPVYPEMPAGAPPRVANADAEAKSAEEMKRYVETIPGSEVTFAMLAIPGGKFRMGSPEGEKDRKPDESAPVEVEIAPFWMEEHETTWDEYRLFQFKLDIELRKAGKFQGQPTDAWADAVSRPTPPYVPMDFGMGLEGFPAISMTEFAARHYTKWLSMKTGRFYRLPTEAEWEYACRAGSTSAYSFGDDVAKLGEHAWYYDNSDARYHKVKEKKPNAWGLYDMHGNVSEWCIDQHDDGSFFRAFAGKLASNPVNWPTKLYPRVVRGGSWDDDADRLRSAARRGSTAGWKVQDPQLPKSIWYLTDAKFVGFRVVRPLAAPSAEEMAKFWEADLDSVREILERQRKGGR